MLRVRQFGSNGGSLGGIEFVGVTSGTQPNPYRTIPSNTWTTVIFDIPHESVANFANGIGALVTASGLGVLEHLAIVPDGGLGAYHIYLDNLIVGGSKVLTFSLDPGAPTGAAINLVGGEFSWTPTEGEGPGTYPITVRVSENESPPQSDTGTFSITVGEANAAPLLAPIANVHAGNSVIFTNSASDADLPASTLTFSLDPGAPLGTAINSGNGVFSWTPNDSFIGSSYSTTVRVTDSGSPQQSCARTFGIAA